MKKSVIFILLILSYLGCHAQQPGDSLAILYFRVYVYRNPDDLSTRLSNVPFSYYDNKKLTFLSTDEKYPDYYKILTPAGDTAFVHSKMVSTDKALKHSQIREEVNNGLRSKNPGTRPEKANIDLPRWASWAIVLSIIVFLYLLWKKYYVIDNWFCRKSSGQPRRLSKPWFITYSLVAGVVIGSVQLFSGLEYKWFMQEGLQLWGKYPNFWDWVMWAAAMSVILIAIITAVQAFNRFPSKLAILNSLLSIIIIAVFFGVGVIVGAIVAVLIFFFAGGSGKSETSGSSGGNSASSSESSGSIKTVNGQRYIKTDSGRWDNF
jgi:hypothetical protein